MTQEAPVAPMAPFEGAAEVAPMAPFRGGVPPPPPPPQPASGAGFPPATGWGHHQHGDQRGKGFGGGKDHGKRRGYPTDIDAAIQYGFQMGLAAAAAEANRARGEQWGPHHAHQAAHHWMHYQQQQPPQQYWAAQQGFHPGPGYQAHWRPAQWWASHGDGEHAHWPQHGEPPLPLQGKQWENDELSWQNYNNRNGVSQEAPANCSTEEKELNDLHKRELSVFFETGLLCDEESDEGLEVAAEEEDEEEHSGEANTSPETNAPETNHPEVEEPSDGAMVTEEYDDQQWEPPADKYEYEDERRDSDEIPPPPPEHAEMLDEAAAPSSEPEDAGSKSPAAKARSEDKGTPTRHWHKEIERLLGNNNDRAHEDQPIPTKGKPKAKDVPAPPPPPKEVFLPLENEQNAGNFMKYNVIRGPETEDDDSLWWSQGGGHHETYPQSEDTPWKDWKGSNDATKKWKEPPPAKAKAKAKEAPAPPPPPKGGASWWNSNGDDTGWKDWQEGEEFSWKDWKATKEKAAPPVKAKPEAKVKEKAAPKVKAKVEAQGYKADLDDLAVGVLQVLKEFPSGLLLSQVKPHLQARCGMTLMEQNFGCSKLQEVFRMPPLDKLFPMEVVPDRNEISIKAPKPNLIPERLRQRLNSDKGSGKGGGKEGKNGAPTPAAPAPAASQAKGPAGKGQPKAKAASKGAGKGKTYVKTKTGEEWTDYNEWQ